MNFSKATYLDLNLIFKTANGRHVPLTDLLGWAVQNKAQPTPNKIARFAPMCSEYLS